MQTMPVEVMEKVFLSLQKMEKDGASLVERAEEHTRCGFSFQESGCRTCIYYSDCRDRIEAARRESWRLQSNAFRSYGTLEKMTREALREQAAEKKNDPDRIALMELLARILRALGSSSLLLSEDRKVRIRQAAEIFQFLFNQTGKREYYKEAEFCRVLANIENF